MILAWILLTFLFMAIIIFFITMSLYSCSACGRNESFVYSKLPVQLDSKLPCDTGARDADYSQDPPFFELGPDPPSHKSCVYYNYTLPPPLDYPLNFSQGTESPWFYWNEPLFASSRKDFQM